MSNVVEYFTVDETSALEIDEKRSRFIAVVSHVESSSEVDAFLSKLKKNNKDAKHIAYAYSIGKNSETLKNNDDGEPAGSAGNPISEAIKQSGLTDIIVAVVRYYGGVQLGKSKLTSTYFKSAMESLKRVKKIKVADCAIYGITVKYPDFVPIGTYLRDHKLPIISAEYGDMVSLRVAFPVNEVDRHLSEIKMKIEEDFLCSKIDSAFIKMD